MSVLMMMAGSKLPISPTPVVEYGVGGTTVVLTKPVGTSSGNLLVSVAAIQFNAPWTPGAGFTERYDNQGVEIATRVAGGSEASSYTFTNAFIGNKQGTILRIPGGSYDTIGSASSSNVSPVAPAITMSGAGLLLAIYHTGNAGVTFSTPTGMTPVAADSTYCSFAIFSQNVGSGSTSTRTSTASSGTGYGVLLGVTS